jgi:hypothetical protein
LISIYAELQALYNEISKSETSVQSKMINSGADAQRDVAYHQGWATRWQAIGSTLGAGVTLATTVGTQFSNKSEIDKLGSQEKQMSQLKDLNELTKNTNLNHPDVVVTNADANDPVNIRRRELLNATNGNYESSQLPNVDATVNENAIKSMSPSERELLQEKLREDITNKTRTTNDIHSTIQTNTTKLSNYSQLGSGGFNALSQWQQASHTSEQGQSQAAQQVCSGVSQMANTTADTGRQGVTKYYDAVGGIISSARQGAQAYAQT